MSDFLDGQDDLDSVLFGDNNSDVSTAADAPASSSETVETAPEADLEAETAAETPAAAEEIHVEEIPTPDTTDKLNWDTAPKAFREKYETDKRELAELRQNSLSEKFLTDEDEFLKDLYSQSSSQFERTAQKIINTGINAHPDAYAKHLAQVNPDAIAKALFGDDFNAAQVRNIITQVQKQDLQDYLTDGDEPAAKAPLNEQQPLTEAQINAMVEKRFNEAQQPQRIEALTNQTFNDIMSPVEALIEQADLADKATDTPEDKKWKEQARDIIRDRTINYLMTDEKNKARADKMQGFINGLDENGVKNLTPRAKALAEDYAGDLIQMLTSRRAVEKTRDTKPKAIPPKVVPSTGASPSFGQAKAQPTGRIGAFSEDDFASVGL